MQAKLEMEERTRIFNEKIAREKHAAAVKKQKQEETFHNFSLLVLLLQPLQEGFQLHLPL